MQVLVFDIFGKFAHFRKYWTTTSPLTFAFPPIPAVAGILGAICGIPRPKHLEIFSLGKCKIGIRVLQPVKKIQIGKNYLDTKAFFGLGKKESFRIPLKMEIVKFPCYRIYVFHENREVFEKLYRNLKEHCAVFSVYLGSSEFLGDFNFVGIFKAEKRENVEVGVISVVGVEGLLKRKLKIEKGSRYFIEEGVPVVMSPERVVKKYEDIIYNVNGGKVVGVFKEVYKLENDEWIYMW